MDRITERAVVLTRLFELLNANCVATPDGNAHRFVDFGDDRKEEFWRGLRRMMIEIVDDTQEAIVPAVDRLMKASRGYVAPKGRAE